MGISRNISEEELIALLQHRDEQAYGYLYDHYAAALYGVVLHMVRNREYAEEIIQDVFVKIWKYAGQFDASRGRLYTWMIQIARNTSLDYLKSKRFQQEQKNQTLPDFVHNNDRFSVVSQVDHIGMKNVLSGLKEEWRELIDLAYFQGYTQQEIAERLNIPLGTVKTRTRNALTELRELLKQYR